MLLRRPCFRKKDALEVYAWLEMAQVSGLERFSIGIGNAESFVADGWGDSLYSSAKGVIKLAVEQTKLSDNAILIKILGFLEKCIDLKVLFFRCVSFENQNELFEALLKTIGRMDKLEHLDLSGCFFTDSQLVELAEAVSKKYVSHFVWPDFDINPEILNDVVEYFGGNRSIVVIENVPLELLNIAKRNSKKQEKKA